MSIYRSFRVLKLSSLRAFFYLICCQYFLDFLNNIRETKLCRCNNHKTSKNKSISDTLLLYYFYYPSNAGKPLSAPQICLQCWETSYSSIDLFTMLGSLLQLHRFVSNVGKILTAPQVFLQCREAS